MLRDFLHGRLALQGVLPKTIKILSVETNRPEQPVHLGQRLMHTWRIRFMVPISLDPQQLEIESSQFELKDIKHAILKRAAPPPRALPPMPVQLELFA